MGNYYMYRDIFVQKTDNNINYYESKKRKISPETKNGVTSALEMAKKNTNLTFFKSIDTHVTTSFKELIPFNSFAQDIIHEENNRNVGLFYFSDTDIYINEKAMKIYLKKHKNSSFEQIAEHVATHEIGHYFDEYYGCKIKDYAEIIEFFNSDYFYNTYSDLKREELITQLHNNNSLSDSADYKKAVLNDIQNLEEEELEKFDMLKNVCKENIDYEHEARSELFANLFAYILGSDDGFRENYLEYFPETTIVVENYIKKYKGEEKNNQIKFDILF